MSNLKNILVIDDDRFILELIKIMLDGEYRVATADDGTLGLRMLRRSPADLVLLDWMMPGLYGMAVLREIMGDPQTREIPVVMVSGRMDCKATQRALGLGAKAVLSKPFRKSELLEAVRSVLAEPEPAPASVPEA